MERNFFYKNEMKLSNLGQTFVNFIEKNPQEFVLMTIKDVAKKTYISISSISKLARKLGFDNFKKLQHWVATENANLKQAKIINNPTSIVDIANNVKTKYQLSIDRSISDINFKLFHKVKKLIEKSSQIYTFGIGSSNLAAHEMANTLNVLNFSATKLDSIHDIFRNINQNNKNSRLIILYSNSLQGKEIKQTRKILNLYNVSIIIFTSNRNLKHASNEIIIAFRTMEQKKRIAALTSKIAQLLLTDIFLNWFGKSCKNEIYDEFSKNWRN